MALLIKDWKLLKNQKQFFGIVIVLAAFYSFFMSGTFVIVYMSVMMGMFTLSTISYDEYNGAAFLFTLPIDRREYAVEKYVFAAISMSAATTVGSVLYVVTGFLKGVFTSGADVTEALVGAFVGALVTICMMLSFMIPLQLKFGAEKSRIVWLGTMLVVALAAFGCVKLMRFLGMDISDLVQGIKGLSPVAFAVTLTAALIGMIVISCLVSVKIMEKREF